MLRLRQAVAVVGCVRRITLQLKVLTWPALVRTTKRGTQLPLPPTALIDVSQAGHCILQYLLRLHIMLEMSLRNRVCLP